LGNGVIKRMYVPEIQTRQFPVSWGMGRKTRIGPQQYLFTRTANGQVTLQIFLSQNAVSSYNNQADNDSLIYSTVLYTCPESTRSEEHTSELQSRENLVCRLLLEKKKHKMHRQAP